MISFGTFIILMYWLIYGKRMWLMFYSIDIHVLRTSLNSFLNDGGFKKDKDFLVLDNLFYRDLAARDDP